jgi:hypothetical protein
MRVRIPFVLTLVTALALTSPGLRAADAVAVSPSNRVLVLDAGKSATIKLDAHGCKAMWTASSDDETAAMVTTPKDKAVPKLSLKVTAPKDALGKTATITVEALGEGGECGFEEEIEIMVFVVMKAKDVEKVFTKGSKGAGIPGTAKISKDFKADVKAAEKALKDEFKDILAGMKAGTLPLPAHPLDPGVTLSQYERAMLLMMIAQYSFVNTIYGLYYTALGGMAGCGYSAMSAYFYSGFFSYFGLLAPIGMLPGGCGSWDKARLGLFQIMLGSINLMNAQLKKSTASVTKEAAKAGQPITCTDGGNTINDPGSAGTSPVGAKAADPNATKALEIHRVRTYNSRSGNKNEKGRMVISGRSKGATVTVTLQPIDAAGNNDGAAIVDMYDVDTETCGYMVSIPPFGEEGSLAPGTYKVIVTNADGETTNQQAVVPNA